MEVASRQARGPTPGGAALDLTTPGEAATRERGLLHARTRLQRRGPSTLPSPGSTSQDTSQRPDSGDLRAAIRVIRTARGRCARRRGLVTRDPRPVWMRRVWVMGRMRLRLVRLRRGRRGSRCRAWAGERSRLRGGRCRRSGRGRSGRTGRASRGRAGMRVRSTPATSGGGSWPGWTYLSQAWPGEAALRRLPVIAGGGSRATGRSAASTSIPGVFDPCDGLTERYGPCHHDGHSDGGRQDGP
jgi:hypothetical protein